MDNTKLCKLINQLYKYAIWESEKPESEWKGCSICGRDKNPYIEEDDFVCYREECQEKARKLETEKSVEDEDDDWGFKPKDPLIFNTQEFAGWQPYDFNNHISQLGPDKYNELSKKISDVWKNIGFLVKSSSSYSHPNMIMSNPIAGDLFAFKTVGKKTHEIYCGYWGSGGSRVYPPELCGVCSVCGNLGDATGTTLDDPFSPGPCHSVYK